MTDARDIPAFGIADPDGEHGLFSIATGTGAMCRLTLVARTERGYPRHEVAAIPLATWRQVAMSVQKELLRGMDPEETGPKAPVFRSGDQALSPLITRELAVLLWSLMEDGEGTHIDALLAGWRQLAREERWWLYARASNPTQRQGKGWRRALFYALTDPADTRTAPRLLEIMEAASAQKKTFGPMRKVNYLEDTKKKPAPRKSAPKVPKKTAPSKPAVKTAVKKESATKSAKTTPRPRTRK
jgi:hypothetical protein